MRVFHDLTKRRLALLNSSRDKLQARSTSEVFVYADINSNLKLRIHNKTFDFNSSEEFDDLLIQNF